MCEVVDSDDAVIDVVPRSRVISERLRHRTAFVIVRDSSGALLVHRRAETKRVAPGEWDLGFGGAVAVGESYEAAAARELHEEAGVRPPLTFVTPYVYDGPDSSELGQLFETVCDGPFEHPAAEIAESRFVTPWEFDPFLATHTVCHAALEVMVHLVRGTTHA